ncbi:hypothetical protein V6N13_072340 [Hibiscus sabdariffa]
MVSLCIAGSNPEMDSCGPVSGGTSAMPGFQGWLHLGCGSNQLHQTARLHSEASGHCFHSRTGVEVSASESAYGIRTGLPHDRDMISSLGGRPDSSRRFTGRLSEELSARETEQAPSLPLHSYATWYYEPSVPHIYPARAVHRFHRKLSFVEAEHSAL